ncbi:acyl carrier protein [Desulfocicer vacuolatum DSM 3385]|uniref:Acyl carrier protein n=1 Tax=Desulfocicer vacuolatum DSM 3385 TaxID=1121400 RepID=A0A1W1Z5P3_9BACT|nr:hypothetical protein [Desulfocicer vacuolatum]SMC43745.1 acyl carrier protein [Desulfocicer vacuolatum DSM 3385]
MELSETLTLMNMILEKQNKEPIHSHDQKLREIGFRSLDFSELALRVEMTTGKELNFDASHLRKIETVSDVLEFFQECA